MDPLRVEEIGSRVQSLMDCKPENILFTWRDFIVLKRVELLGLNEEVFV